jgi:hypothetical protein
MGTELVGSTTLGVRVPGRVHVIFANLVYLARVDWSTSDAQVV